MRVKWRDVIAGDLVVGNGADRTFQVASITSEADDQSRTLTFVGVSGAFHYHANGIVEVVEDLRMLVRHTRLQAGVQDSEIGVSL